MKNEVADYLIEKTLPHSRSSQDCEGFLSQLLEIYGNTELGNAPEIADWHRGFRRLIDYLDIFSSSESRFREVLGDGLNLPKLTILPVNDLNGFELYLAIEHVPHVPLLHAR